MRLFIAQCNTGREYVKAHSTQAAIRKLQRRCKLKAGRYDVYNIKEVYSAPSSRKYV